MKAKKMIVPILMGVLMTFAILPMTAGKAYAEDYGLHVGCITVTDANNNVLEDDPVNDGKVSFTPAEGGNPATLTLSGAEITWEPFSIESYIPDLTIEVNGENKLSGWDVGIYSTQNLTITGNGSLQVEGSKSGIRSEGGVTIKDATVTATATGNDAGIYAKGEVKIEGSSKVQAKGENAIRSNDKIILGGHAITDPEGGKVSNDGKYIATQNGDPATSVTIERVVKMNGDGTEGSPYQIKTYEDLKEFASIVNGEHHLKAPQNRAACGKLMNDITCDDKKWVPIGNANSPYIGHFDGDQNEIRYLSNEETGAEKEGQGLFGEIGAGGVENVSIVGGIIEGKNYVGAVVGHNTGGEITNCYNAGAVSGTGNYVGGMAGFNSDDITNCCNTGAVSGTGDNVGGMVGRNNNGRITDCYNMGAVSGTGNNVGGMAGYISGDEISNSYNTGAVSGSNYVGGLTGTNVGNITNCYNTGAVSGSNNVGGVSGRGSGIISSCYYDKTFSIVSKAVGSYDDTGNVKGLTTSQMTGTDAIGKDNMAFEYTGSSPWLVKGDGPGQNGVYYWYYPHLKGFAYDMSSFAANWPAKVIVDADWKESASYMYNASAQKPTVTGITVSQKPVEVPEGKTAEYSRRTDGGWEALSSAPTDPGTYKMTVKDGGKVIDVIVFIILNDTDYKVYYYKQTGEDSGSGEPTWSTDNVEPIAAGTYKAVVTHTDGTVLLEKEFQIKQAPLTITANDQTLTYNGQTQGEGDTTYEDAAQIAEKVTTSGLKGSDKLTKIDVFSQGKEVGEYPITLSGAAIGNATANYAITYVNGKLTITKAKPKPKPQPKPQPKTNKAAAKTALDAGVVAKSSGSKVTASWGAVKGASSYVIYANYCDQKECKKIKTVSGKTTSFDITKLNGKKFNPKKNLKFYVVAYKTVKGKKVKLAQSILAHAPGSKNSKRTNVTGVKVKKAAFTLKKGKTAKIKAKLILQKKGKKPLKHEAKFRYASSNKKVAKVSKKGKITAVGKGKCTVYVYAVSGVSKKIKVTVK